MSVMTTPCVPSGVSLSRSRVVRVNRLTLAMLGKARTYSEVPWFWSDQFDLKLQIAGCIRYRRGHISVLDRTGLEALSCECYCIAKREADRLLQVSRSARIAVTQAAVNRVRSERSEPSTRHAASSFA